MRNGIEGRGTKEGQGDSFGAFDTPHARNNPRHAIISYVQI